MQNEYLMFGGTYHRTFFLTFDVIKSENSFLTLDFEQVRSETYSETQRRSHTFKIKLFVKIVNGL